MTVTGIAFPFIIIINIKFLVITDLNFSKLSQSYIAQMIMKFRWSTGTCRPSLSSHALQPAAAAAAAALERRILFPNNFQFLYKAVCLNQVWQCWSLSVYFSFRFYFLNTSSYLNFSPRFEFEFKTIALRVCHLFLGVVDLRLRSHVIPL
jgi:hypothetical protein